MMRKSLNINSLPVLIFAAVLTGCSPVCPDPESGILEIDFTVSGQEAVKSADPGPDVINDLNIFIINKEGIVEDHRYIRNSVSYSTRLIKGLEYTAVAFANFGYDVKGFDTYDALKKYRYHIAYPDEYSRGMPMCGKVENINLKDKKIEVKLERLMSRISLRIDRSGLDKGIEFNVMSVSIGNCPRSVCPLTKSRAENNMDVFKTGFMKSFGEADALNMDKSPGLSGEVCLYMLENMNGDLLPEAETDRDKMLDKNPAMSEVCSYIELRAEYKSKEFISRPEEYLVYRFYLGHGKGNFDIIRNCSYRFTVRPEGNGLSEDSWRVDKSGLGRTGKAKIKLLPGTYIEGKVGESIRIRAETTPPNAFMQIGLEELEFDKERGIYDYAIDDDGRGVTLELKSRGSGILYFEAGYPTSDSAAAVIVVN